MATVQMEITSACHKSCANCSRFCGHYRPPWFMSFDQFREAIDSMVGYPRMVGFQGGEPLLHPEFERFCTYAKEKIGYKKLGLWTALPNGFEHHRKTICETFYYIFVNDHSRDDIFHHPGLVAIEEVVKDKNQMWQMIDRCWVQETWSASVNPKGAFFCEMAAAQAVLFPDEDHQGWKVEPGWWWRTTKDYREQIEKWCPRCGFACPLDRKSSVTGVDELSPMNYDRLKATSPKIARGMCKVSDLKMADSEKPLAAYKNNAYRERIARRYGIFLVVNNDDTSCFDGGSYWTPYLYNNFSLDRAERSISSMLEER